MDLQRTDVERAAVPTERPLRVELQHRLRQPVIIGAVMHAARDVAEDLARLLQCDGDAVLAQCAAQPEHVAEQEVGPVQSLKKAGRDLRRPVIVLRGDWHG